MTRNVQRGYLLEIKSWGGGRSILRVEVGGDLIQQQLATLEWQDGDRRLPKVTFAPQVIEAMALPCVDALAIKLLGKHISYTALRAKLGSLWRLQGGFEVMNVGNDYFMVKFDLEADRAKVIERGPWMIMDHYLAVKLWTPDFNPSEECFGKTMVWFRLSGLNLLYYHESALRTIVAGVGKLVRVDVTTKTVERGRFARVCAEVDLNHPVVRKVWINDHWHEVEYENLHLICSSFDCYGHMARNCKVSGAREVVQERQVTEVKVTANALADACVIIDESRADAIQKTVIKDSENQGMIFKETRKNSNDTDSDGWITVGGRRKSRVTNKGKDYAHNDKLGVRIRTAKFAEQL